MVSSFRVLTMGSGIHIIDCGGDKLSLVNKIIKKIYEP